jgi:uncharacterized membrane protein YphA (DoxX/SURF4 family)
MTITTKQSELNNLWTLLKFTFGLVPIVAGADKFFNILVQWDTYVHPSVAELLPMNVSTFMLIVGVIEIIAGILVFIKTELGAYIVSAWLVGIALSLILTGHHLDVAVRDIVMAIGAFVLARLTLIKNNGGF